MRDEGEKERGKTCPASRKGENKGGERTKGNVARGLQKEFLLDGENVVRKRGRGGKLVGQWLGEIVVGKGGLVCTKCRLKGYFMGHEKRRWKKYRKGREADMGQDNWNSVQREVGLNGRRMNVYTITKKGKEPETGLFRRENSWGSRKGASTGGDGGAPQVG